MAARKSDTKLYVIDTNVLIHDPAAILNFEEHQVVIPMTVLEELDKLKMGKASIATDCREAIRQIDRIIGDASPTEIAKGIPIERPDGDYQGHFSILLDTFQTPSRALPDDLNDNKIINSLVTLQEKYPMRLKARGCGVGAQDYQNDQLLSDVSLLETGYHHIEGSFWETQEQVETFHDETGTYHRIPRHQLPEDIIINRFISDDKGFIGKVHQIGEEAALIKDLPYEQMMQTNAWGLKPRDPAQAMALNLLLDPDIHLVTLSGQAGSGKTILALAAAIEMAEKMEPWLGAITDNLEALHCDDENATSSVDYILQKVPLQFKSLNYIRGRSFQHSLILIDECQNLTPHQMKTIITRAGAGSKVICLGNLAQIDTPYLNPISSGLTYLIERFKHFPHGGTIHLQGSPRSELAEYAESHL